MQRGLFSRLERGTRQIDSTESVIAHLHALLNQRSILDLTDLAHSLPEGMRAVEGRIREVIEQYEPRLTAIAVRHIPTDDPLKLEFTLQGRVATEPNRSVRLRTWVKMPGRFSVG